MALTEQKELENLQKAFTLLNALEQVEQNLQPKKKRLKGEYSAATKLKNNAIEKLYKTYANLLYEDDDTKTKLAPLKAKTATFKDFEKVNNECKILEGLNDLVGKNGYFDKEIEELQSKKVEKFKKLI